MDGPDYAFVVFVLLIAAAALVAVIVAHERISELEGEQTEEAEELPAVDPELVRLYASLAQARHDRLDREVGGPEVEKVLEAEDRLYRVVLERLATSVAASGTAAWAKEMREVLDLEGYEKKG